jgi:hypothetical protein
MTAQRLGRRCASSSSIGVWQSQAGISFFDRTSEDTGALHRRLCSSVAQPRRKSLETMHSRCILDADDRALDGRQQRQRQG